MQPIQLNQTLGYYNPGFFKLYIASLTPIDLRTLTDQELATFVHEYTHFLQDFTTITGLHNIFTIYEWVRLYVTETYKHRKVDIPVNFKHEAIGANTKLKKHAFGTPPHPSLNHISSLQNIKLEQTLSAEIIQKYPELGSFRALSAEAVLPNGTIKRIQIGTLAAMESMSHLVEGLMGLPVTNSPDYPYNAVKLLAEALCPSIHLDDEILFALCDVSLQCSIPGKALYDMLTNIENRVVPAPRDGYEVYRAYADQFHVWSDLSENSLASQAKDHLIKLVQGPVGERYERWINNIFQFSVTRRSTNPSFLIDEIRKHSRYIQIVNTIGTPLMVNAVEQYSKVPVNFGKMFPSDMDVEFFPAIIYLMQMFLLGKRECPMQPWCQMSEIDIDDNCITNPPARSDISNYSKLCPVGVLWRSWNLSRYRLKKQRLFRPICK